MPADDVEDRRRRGLPDYEKPPLGQPPSWLQEQEVREPVVDDLTVAYIEAHPTMELRFVSRMETIDPLARTAVNSVTQTGRVIRILRQRWAIIGFNAHNRPVKRDTEWRDVPLVDE